MFFKNYLDFNGIIISTSFVPFSPVTSVIFCLNLNEALLSAAWKIVIAPAAVKVGFSL